MDSMNRRQFIQSSALTAAGLCLPHSRAASPNEKLNIAVVGLANRGADNIREITSENIVAICDVDENYLAAAAQKFPAAQKYHDFRRMLDQKDIDAVLVATPDHTHAVVSSAVLKSGRHLYCEKPLTHTISECRAIRELAKKQGRVTQLGTQIHAGNNYRRVVELVQSGTIGEIKEVHVWVSASYGGKTRPANSPPVPPTLHYDLWLGPVEPRPYHPAYLPKDWRHWWAFGGGALADFGCHYMDLPHWALDLRNPLSAEAEAPPLNPECPPVWMIVRYAYPARGTKPPVNLTWYHGGKQPDLLPPEQKQKWKSGVLFLGSKGSLLSDYSRRALLPEKDFQGFVPPAPSIPNSIGHHKEWIHACKTGGSTTCNFDYSGALTEAALLGNAAHRVGKKIEWDWERLQARNVPEAAEFIRHHYRAGWAL